MSRRNSSLSIGYLCLEAPREGQASHVHSTEIVKGLETFGHDIDYIAPDYGWPRPNLWRRFLKSLAIQTDLIRRLNAFSMVYVRAHPLAFPTALACRLRGVPVIQEINGNFQDVYLPYPRMRHIQSVFESAIRPSSVTRFPR